MNDIAHLRFRGGGLILPADTPYERELLVECVAATTKRYGRLRLELDGRHWTIRTSNGRRPVCDSCSQWPDDLTYPGGWNSALAVVSSLAIACRETTCDLAPVGHPAGTARARAASRVRARFGRQLR